MEAVRSRLPMRLFIIVLVVAAIAGGFVLRDAVSGAGGSPTSDSVAPEKPVTIDDLMLIAAKSKNGITMSYEGVTGPPNSTDHTNHIALNSLQWGVGRGIAGGTGGAGREASTPSVSEIVVTKQMDAASVDLLRQSMIGENANVVIYFTDTKNKANPTYLQIELENVLVSSYSTSSGGDLPSESLSLNFTKITFRANLGTGEKVFSYDLAQHTGG